MEEKVLENEITLEFLETTIGSLSKIMPSKDTVIVVLTPDGKFTLDKDNVRIVRNSGCSEIVFNVNI